MGINNTINTIIIFKNLRSLDTNFRGTNFNVKKSVYVNEIPTRQNTCLSNVD